MALVVVGGHSRNIGKTSVMVGLLAALNERRWTAIKITQFGHGICSAHGKSCECATADHRVAISEERDASRGKDTSRYLAAGAERSLWVRTQVGSLHEAMPRLRAEFVRAAADGRDVMVESNSLLRFVRPAVYVSVLDPAVEDFKGSARQFLDRADAVVLPKNADLTSSWGGAVARLTKRVPCVRFAPPVYVSDMLVQLVRERLHLGES